MPINAGVAFAANGSEDKTIPDWMLPGTFGSRAFPDKVDLALIIGWGRGSPPPTLALKRRIKIVLVEVGYTHDHHIPARVDEKHTKYVALAMALRDAGWKVILCDSAGDPDVWFKSHIFRRGWKRGVSRKGHPRLEDGCFQGFKSGTMQPARSSEARQW